MDEDDDKSRLYEVLNVSRTATETEIRESHRRLSRLFHPDKHTDDTTRNLADPKFQEIQHAFEVLSDPQKRAIYDNLGEDGLTMKLEVGQRHMTPQELKLYWLNQARQQRVDELDSLTQCRGSTSMTIDARSMFGDRVVVEQHTRLGSPIPIQIARPATWSERASDVMFRGLSMRQSYTIPFTFSKLFVDDDDDLVPQSTDHESALTLTSHATTSNRKAPGNFGITAALRHRLNNKTTLEASLPLLAPRAFRSKIIHQHSPELFVTLDSTIATFSHPPDLTLTTGRQITARGVLFGTLRSGSPWKLGPWGEYGNSAAYILGWTRNPIPTDPTGYSVELITGLQVLGLATDYNTEFPDSGIKLKLGGSITTNGLAFNLGASRKLTHHTRLGANIQSNGQTLIVRLSFQRLGQTFKVPVWIGDGYDPGAILYGILAPLAGLLAFEYFYISPRQQKRSKRLLENRKREAHDRLAKLEKSARESVVVMNESITRRQQLAREKGDLWIEEASYGTREARIDVTIALAALISDNQLIIPKTIKLRSLTGFWDPAFGEHKTLRISYRFRDHTHFIEFGDRDGVAIPSHLHRH